MFDAGKDHVYGRHEVPLVTMLQTHSTPLYLTWACCSRSSSASSTLQVRERLPEAGQPAVRRKLQQLLQHAARGVLANAATSDADVMRFAYAQLRKTCTPVVASQNGAHVAVTVHAPRGGAMRNGVRMRGSTSGHAANEALSSAADAAAALHEALVTEFALTLLSRRLRKGGIDLKLDQDALQRLDPLLPLLTAALDARATPVVTLALKCLSSLVHAPLPGLPAAAGAAGGAPNTTTPVAQVRGGCSVPSPPLSILAGNHWMRLSLFAVPRFA
jgi:hypothetical protein